MKICAEFTIGFIFYFMLLFTNVSFPQLVDTTDFFPMQTGNYWEYAASTINGPEYLSIEVLGDTIMPNGKNYKTFAEKRFYNPDFYSYFWFFRKVSNKVYYAFPYSECSDGEYVYLDFSQTDSSVWRICRDLNPCGNARGIAQTYYDDTYYTYFQKPLETKVFWNVQIDSADTIWAPCVDGSIPIWVAKGIGMIREFIPQDGDYRLQGAIISGVKFGTITDVKEDKPGTPSDFYVEVYPNPFNSTVTFKLSLPGSGFTEMYIYRNINQPGITK